MQVLIDPCLRRLSRISRDLRLRYSRLPDFLCSHLSASNVSFFCKLKTEIDFPFDHFCQLPPYPKNIISVFVHHTK